MSGPTVLENVEVNAAQTEITWSYCSSTRRSVFSHYIRCTMRLLLRCPLALRTLSCVYSRSSVVGNGISPVLDLHTWRVEVERDPRSLRRDPLEYRSLLAINSSRVFLMACKSSTVSSAMPLSASSTPYLRTTCEASSSLPCGIQVCLYSTRFFPWLRLSPNIDGLQQCKP